MKVERPKPVGQCKRPGTGVRNKMTQLRKHIFFDRTRTRLEWWEEHLFDPLAALAKALACLGESLLGLALGFTAVAFSIAGVNILQKMWERPHREGVWSHLDHGMWCVCAHRPASGTSEEAR